MSGRRLERFTAAVRAATWRVVIAEGVFIILAIAWRLR